MRWEEMFLWSMGLANPKRNDTPEEHRKVSHLMRALKKQYPNKSPEERKSMAIAMLKANGGIRKAYGNDETGNSENE